MMIYGTKILYSPIGWVADFCPICRRLERFQLIEVRKAFHVNTAILSEEHLFHWIRCTSCASPMLTDRGRYTVISQLPQKPVASMAAVTMPDLSVKLGARLHLERQVQSGAAISAQSRAWLMAEPFQVVDWLLWEDRARGTYFAGPSAWGCIAAMSLITLFLPLYALLNWLSVSPSTTDSILKGVGLLIAASALYSFVNLKLRRRRFARLEIIPRLARALKPLHPAKLELQEMLSAYRKTRRREGRWINVEPLWNALMTAEQAPHAST